MLLQSRWKLMPRWYLSRFNLESRENRKANCFPSIKPFQFTIQNERAIEFSQYIDTSYYLLLYIHIYKNENLKLLHHLGLCIVATNEISLTSTATSTDDESQNNLQPDDPSLDYIMNDDGSCQCKLCGEKVASRTHWYRHKYKVHNVALFRCEKCEIFFKSKKGYEGHIANKHAPKIIGTDGKPKTKKDVEGLNKVSKIIKTEFCNLLTSTN